VYRQKTSETAFIATKDTKNTESFVAFVIFVANKYAEGVKAA
jgi:hypothetical protein